MSKSKKFTEKKWHAKPMYQCDRCSWSTLELEEMEKHSAKHDAEERPRVRHVDTGLIGPSGGKIVREEPVEPVTPAEEDSDE